MEDDFFYTLCFVLHTSHFFLRFLKNSQNTFLTPPSYTAPLYFSAPHFSGTYSLSITISLPSLAHNLLLLSSLAFHPFLCASVTLPPHNFSMYKCFESLSLEYIKCISEINFWNVSCTPKTSFLHIDELNENKAITKLTNCANLIEKSLNVKHRRSVHAWVSVCKIVLEWN